MNWKDDLANLLADVATSTPGQAVGGVLGSAPVQGAFNVLNAPLSAVQYGTGGAIGLINEGLGLLPGQPGFERGTSEAWHSGDLAGAPRRAWDEVREDQPLWFQAPTELLLDPMTYTGAGLVGKGAAARRLAQADALAAGNTFAATRLGALAKGGEIAQGINDAPGKYLLEPLQRGITKGADKFRSPGGMGTGLLDLSPKSQHKLKIDSYLSATADARASQIMQPSMYLGGTTSRPFSVGNTALMPHPGLVDEQNAALAEQLSDGTTVGKFIEDHALIAQADSQKLKADGVTWKADEKNLDDWLAAVKGTPNETENEKIVRFWHKENIDPLRIEDPDHTAILLLDGRLQKEKGLRESGRSYAYSLFKSAWGEQALASGKYHTGNMLSNWTMTAIQGHLSWDQFNPLKVFDNFKMFNAGENTLKRDRILATTKVYQQAEKYGEDGAAVAGSIMGGGAKDLIGSPTESAIGTIAGKLTRSDKIGSVVSKPFVWNNQFALGVDFVPRDAIYSDVKELAMTTGLKDWESKVRLKAPSAPDFTTFGAPSSPPSLAAGPLKSHLQSLGIKSGDAEDLTRDYLNLRNSANKQAREEMGKVQFNYLKTNLDEHVAKFVPFHYWYSRGLRFFGEASVRNPALFLNYMRANRGIEDANADPGLSARQKGFINLMATPLGYSLLMNPDALFGVVKVFDMDSPENPNADPNAKWHDAPSGMTPMGGVLDWMKNRGVGLYPWMDGLINMMGNYGNTFEPDLLGIRHKGLVGAAVNFAMSQAGGVPPGTPYANAMGQARWALSNTASSFMPGFLAQPVAPKAGGSTQEASLDTIIEHIILSDQPGMTGEQLFEIMSDPESPEYTAAYQKAASAGVIQQLLNFTLPMQFSMRNDARDVRTAQKKVFEEGAERAGVPPFQYQPTVGDLKFAADYERLTGNPWKPGDYESASFQVDLARAPDGEAKRFIYEDAAYHELGTPEQRKTFETYKDLKYRTDPRTAGLDEAQADMMARTWLDRVGGRPAIDAVYDQQEAFKATHPAYAMFLKWQDDMRQVQTMYGGLSQYRQMAAAQNPNAARFFDEKRAHILRTDPQNLETRMEEETISAAAYQAIIGQGAYRSQPGGIPGAPQFDTALPGMLPTAPPEQPYNPQENWMAQLARVGQSQGVWAPRR